MRTNLIYSILTNTVSFEKKERRKNALIIVRRRRNVYSGEKERKWDKMGERGVERWMTMVSDDDVGGGRRRWAVGQWSGEKKKWNGVDG